MIDVKEDEGAASAQSVTGLEATLNSEPVAVYDINTHASLG